MAQWATWRSLWDFKTLSHCQSCQCRQYQQVCIKRVETRDLLTGFSDFIGSSSTVTLPASESRVAQNMLRHTFLMMGLRLNNGFTRRDCSACVLRRKLGKTSYGIVSLNITKNTLSRNTNRNWTPTVHFSCLTWKSERVKEWCGINCCVLHTKKKLSCKSNLQLIIYVTLVTIITPEKGNCPWI